MIFPLFPMAFFSQPAQGDSEGSTGRPASAVRVVFDSRLELAKERARRLLKGEGMGKLPYGRFFQIDLSTERCGLCHGSYAPSGYVVGLQEPDRLVYVHVGCFAEAENWVTEEDEAA